jgi:hypothetical protein
MFTHHKRNIITSEGLTTIHYKIDWDQIELIETHDHEEMWSASGYDSINELEFTGTLCYCDGQFADVMDIECITDSNVEI